MDCLISIILPNYNHVNYLPDRIDSILSQSFKNWECIVIDGFSRDGSWEYINQKVDKDNRFRLFQEEPNGPYDAWNKGIMRSRGKYVYIATSDDTMKPECLEIMINALEKNPKCHYAHCCLTVINENGQLHNSQWAHWDNITFFGKLINTYHIRNKPHDFFVHAGWSTIYTSITQLLIKKEMFELIGLFRSNIGSAADFEWGVRAAMVGNVVHVPEYLATWRIHTNQLTDFDYLKSDKFSIHLCNMIEMAYSKVKNIAPEISQKDIYNLQYIYRRQFLLRSLKNQSFAGFIKVLIKQFNIHRQAAVDFLINLFSLTLLKRVNPNKYIHALIQNYESKKKLIEIIEFED